MFRTSMLVSDLIDGFARKDRLYRRGRFPRPWLLSMCVGVLGGVAV